MAAKKTIHYGMAVPIETHKKLDAMAKKLGVTKKMVVMLALDKLFNEKENKGGEK